jgi:SAM-dependent methyltransferase
MNSGTSHPSSLKAFIKGIPLVGPTAARLSQLPVFMRVRRLAFPGSASFWESEYREGRTSGPGSYGRLAEFKAEILNGFVRTRNIRTIIELGCGDGAQLQLATYPEYVGVDVASLSIDRCSALFAHDSAKRFYLANALPKDLGTFDVALSLDVIYHLVEDSVFDEYMRRLFSLAQRYVVIYASNYDALTRAPHVRHRKFTEWIEKKRPDWRADGFVPNRFPFDPKRPEDTSHADFYFFIRQMRETCIGVHE